MVSAMSVSARWSSAGVTPGSLRSLIVPLEPATRAVVVDGVVPLTVAAGACAPLEDALPHPDPTNSSTAAATPSNPRRITAPLDACRRGYADRSPRRDELR